MVLVVKEEYLAFMPFGISKVYASSIVGNQIIGDSDVLSCANASDLFLYQPATPAIAPDLSRRAIADQVIA
jgi:hypothetical protein